MVTFKIKIRKYFVIILILSIFFLSGVVSAGYCYQESANESNQTGVDGDCELSYDGNYSFEGVSGADVNVAYAGYEISNIYDGSYSGQNSESYTIFIGNLSINYTIPTNATDDTIWRWETFVVGFNQAIIPSDCMQTDTLQLNIEAYQTWPPSGWANFTCYDGSGWVQLFYESGGTSGMIYDEAMNWSIISSCTESIVNTTWTEWENQTGCLINGTILQNRSLVQYDENFCGETENITFWDYQEIECLAWSGMCYWNLDENSSDTNVFDTYFKFNGTSSVNTENLFSSESIRNSAFNFSIGDEYVDTNLDYDLSGSGDFSVSIWIKGVDPDYAISQSHTIDTYSSDWFIGYNSALFWFRSKTLGNRALVEDSEWHHLVMVWDISTGTYEGFVDGESIGTSAPVYGYGGVGTIKIGSRGDGTTSFYDGLIDEVYIVNRSLNSSEIYDLYTFTMPPIITINTPTGDDINIYTFDLNLGVDKNSHCEYSIDNNLNVSLGTATSFVRDITLTDGIHTINVYCNSTYNGLSSNSNVTFLVRAYTGTGGGSSGGYYSGTTNYTTEDIKLANIEVLNDEWFFNTNNLIFVKVKDIYNEFIDPDKLTIEIIDENKTMKIKKNIIRKSKGYYQGTFEIEENEKNYVLVNITATDGSKVISQISNITISKGTTSENFKILTEGYVTKITNFLDNNWEFVIGTGFLLVAIITIGIYNSKRD